MNLSKNKIKFLLRSEFTLEKLALLFQALLCTFFLYLAYNTLFFEVQKLFDGLRPEDWQRRVPLLLLERSLCAIVYLGGGWFFFYRLLVPRNEERKKLFGRNKKKTSLPLALLWGLSGGLLTFSLLFIFVGYGESLFGFGEDLEGQTRNFHLKKAIEADPSLLLWHLLFSALLTALLEEGYYRACLQNYLEGFLAPFFSVSISALVFALVHGEVFYFMIPAALLFSLLYWKQGLPSAITAHTVYNALILLVAAGTIV